MAASPDRKRQLKLIAGLLCYALLYFAIVDPVLGTVPGFERPTVTGRYDPMSPRGAAFVLLGIPFMLAYAFCLPKLAGTTMAAYWGTDRPDGE